MILLHGQEASTLRVSVKSNVRAAESSVGQTNGVACKYRTSNSRLRAELVSGHFCCMYRKKKGTYDIESGAVDRGRYSVG